MPPMSTYGTKLPLSALFCFIFFSCTSKQGVSMVAGGISMERKQVNKVDRGNKGISMVVRGINMVNR